MNARIGWTLSAIGLVAMFIAVRLYVGPKLEQEMQRETHTRTHVVRPLPVGPKPSVTKRPAETVTPREREPDPLAPLEEVYGRVAVLTETSDEGWEDSVGEAHNALDTVGELPIEWTPERAERALEMMAELEEMLPMLRKPEPGLAAHVLAARAELEEQVDLVDPETTARLEAARAEHPEQFAWER